LGNWVYFIIFVLGFYSFCVALFIYGLYNWYIARSQQPKKPPKITRRRRKQIISKRKKGEIYRQHGDERTQEEIQKALDDQIEKAEDWRLDYV